MWVDKRGFPPLSLSSSSFASQGDDLSIIHLSSTVLRERKRRRKEKGLSLFKRDKEGGREGGEDSARKTTPVGDSHLSQNSCLAFPQNIALFRTKIIPHFWATVCQTGVVVVVFLCFPTRRLSPSGPPKRPRALFA